MQGTAELLLNEMKERECFGASTWSTTEGKVLPLTFFEQEVLLGKVNS